MTWRTPDRLDAEPAEGIDEPRAPESEPDRAEDPRRRDAALAIERAETELEALDAALGRLLDGTYGSCAGCGAPIDPSVLAEDPVAVRCTACAGALEPSPGGEDRI